MPLTQRFREPVLKEFEKLIFRLERNDVPIAEINLYVECDDCEGYGHYISHCYHCSVSGDTGCRDCDGTTKVYETCRGCGGNGGYKIG